MLSVPVTDFELSVRSRNCLQKMGVMTLGDLARTTEADLLNSKNFGETSLVEIREMMDAKGLGLGMFAKEAAPPEPIYEPEVVTPDEQALLDRPIADLQLSVRARKCMVRLGIATVAELVRRTGDDLLGMQELRRDQLERSPREVDSQGIETAGRLMRPA